MLLAALAVLAATPVAEGLAREPEPTLSNQVGINPARATPAIRRPVSSYPVSYKRHLGEAWALRLGLDGIYTSQKGAEKLIDVALGVERAVVESTWWRLAYGLDAVFAGKRFNGSRRHNESYGVSPLFSVAWRAHRHFSISTEAKIDVIYSVFREPGAFDPTLNTEDWTVRLGALGSLMLNFHF